MDQFPPRDQVPVEQTWNLADIYPTLEGWEADVARVDDPLQAVTAYRGRLSEGPAILLACLRARDSLQETTTKVAAYAEFCAAADSRSPQNQGMAARRAALNARVQTAISFMDTELGALPVGVIEDYLVAEPMLNVYRFQLEKVLQRQPHLFAPETEEAIAALGEVLSAPFTVWMQTTAIDLRCPAVQDAAGQEVTVSINGYVFELSQSPDRELRRQAYESLASGIGHHQATLAATLATVIKRNVSLARLRRYASAAEMLLAERHVPEPVYRMVLTTVHDEIAPPYRRLMRLKQRVLGLARVHRYDIDAPLAPDYEPAITFSEAGRLVRDGLAPLGGEYGAMVEAAFRDRWIDRSENAGNRSGAFGGNVYGVHPYVFTTWKDNLRSAFIVAHELGHAGNMLLAARQQVMSNASLSIFFSEAPSTCNELLLGRYLLSTTLDLRRRRWIILQFLGTFIHNMVTHMLEAHFEQRLYDLAEAGKPVTLSAIQQVQSDVFERFYEGTVEVDDAARLYWSQQGHFYGGLISAGYSAGLACSCNVVEAIEQEGQPAVDRWLRALQAGSRLPPLELMQIAGVDLTRPEPIRRAVGYFDNLVGELEQAFA